MFVNVIPGDSYQNSAGQGTDIWSFLGYRPLIMDWLIWTVVSGACLRLVKSTTSALFGVAALHCFASFLDWWKWRDYFTWLTWVSIAFCVGIYLLLGILACRSRLLAALLGLGLYAALLAIPALSSTALLPTGLFWKIPTVALLFAALLFAFPRQLARRLVWGGSVLGMTVLCCASFTSLVVGVRLLPVTQDPRDGVGHMITAGFLGLCVFMAVLVPLVVFRKNWIAARSEMPSQNSTPGAGSRA